jgi:hypothetical protein
MTEELDIIEFDRPTRGSKEGYLMLHFNARQQLGRIIADPEQQPGNNRIVTFTKYMISSITDDEIRENIRVKYQTGLDELKREDLSNEDRHERTINISMEILGDITAFYDEFLGISHRLKIGMV